MMPSHDRAIHSAINIGLVANFILAILKTAFGIFGHSAALLADGINSTSDVAYYIVVKVFIFFAGKPPDREHPYGHSQLESIAALTVGAFIITTAIAIFWDAINSVYEIASGTSSASQVAEAALWVAVLTIFTKLGLTFYTQRTASQSGNAAILALARDHRNDIFSACGATAGIILNRIGYTWGDPLVGAIVAVIILITGIQILRESSADLMDAVPSDALEQQVRTALQNLPGLLAVEEMQAHRFGPYLILHITIGVDGALSVARGDQIASDVENKLTNEISLLRRVYVHYHPLQDNRT
ncbi:MAG: cation diffusion facilitator family transporter [bacterium]|nr:cation diffusion facilitator family transporter [bacterium]